MISLISTRRLLLALALPLALSMAARAQTSWTPVGPFGGVTTGLTADPSRSGVLYASGSGVFKTADGGASWVSIYPGPAQTPVAVDSGHPETLYFVRASGWSLLKSTDGGGHWRAILPLSRLASAVAVDPGRPGRLYLGLLGGGILRSSDGGLHWQAANAGLRGGAETTINALAVSRPAGRAFAATPSGVYRTTNAGDTWKLLRGGLPAAPAAQVAVSPSDPRTAYAALPLRGLYRTTDGGDTWHRVSALQGTDVLALAVSPRSPGTLYTSFERGLSFRSRDGGLHWTPLRGLPSPSVEAFAFDPSAPGRVYAGLYPDQAPYGHDPGGVARSDDGGDSWTRRNQGMTGLEALSLAADPEDPDRLWTSLGGMLFRSANRGARWARVPLPPWTGFAGQAGIGSSSRAFVLAAANVSTPPAVWRTEDDGASWEWRYGTFKPGSLLRIAPSLPSTLYVLSADRSSASAASLYRSTDSGEIWQLLLQVSPLLDCGVGDLAVAPSNASVLYLGGSGSGPFSCKPPVPSRILRSEDGGASWTDVSAGLPSDTVVAVAVDPRDPRTAYASVAFLYTGAGAGVWKTTDGGASWTLTGNGIGDEKVTALLASSLSGRVYAATGDGHVFRSDDGGASWDDWSAGLSVTGVSGLLADPAHPRRIYAVTTNGVWRLTETD